MKFCLLIIVSFIFNANVFAQKLNHKITVKSDNDAYLWYGQDRYYTNGLFINYLFAKQNKAKKYKRIFDFSIGQKLYNPRSGYSPFVFTHDRPFAAYLYGSGNIIHLLKQNLILQTGIELGVIGPKALGKEGQTFLHQLVGFYEIKGWEYQIGDDFAANLNLKAAKTIYQSNDKSNDLILESFAKIGTTFDAIGIGMSFRAGKINSINETSYFQSDISNQQVKKEIYFYAKPLLKYIAYDATIEGSMFHANSPVTFDVKPLVFSQVLGFNYSSKHFGLDYHIIFNTKEVKSNAKAHQYGSISLSYKF